MNHNDMTLLAGTVVRSHHAYIERLDEATKGANKVSLWCAIFLVGFILQLPGAIQ